MNGRTDGLTESSSHRSRNCHLALEALDARVGTPFEPDGLHDDFKRILTKAELPDIRFHYLRYSAASLMLAQGIPLRSIQDILGHSSIALSANPYAQVGEQLRREAADAMDAILVSQ